MLTMAKYEQYAVLSLTFGAKQMFDLDITEIDDDQCDISIVVKQAGEREFKVDIWLEKRCAEDDVADTSKRPLDFACETN